MLVVIIARGDNDHKQLKLCGDHSEVLLQVRALFGRCSRVAITNMHPCRHVNFLRIASGTMSWLRRVCRELQAGVTWNLSTRLWKEKETKALTSAKPRTRCTSGEICREVAEDVVNSHHGHFSTRKGAGSRCHTGIVMIEEFQAIFARAIIAERQIRNDVLGKDVWKSLMLQLEITTQGMR